MPSIKNRNSASTNGATLSATNKNDINIKVIVGDVVKKRKPRRRAAPSGGSSGPSAPQQSVTNNIMPSPQPTTQATSYNDPPSMPPPPLPRSGGSMYNRPYDVVDAGVGTVGEDAPEGLRSNFEAYQATRERYFMSLQEQMEDLAGTDYTDLTVAPSEADGSIQHGAQGEPSKWHDNDSYLMPDDDPEALPEPHRSATFALPPTQATLALPAPPTAADELAMYSSPAAAVRALQAGPSQESLTALWKHVYPGITPDELRELRDYAASTGLGEWEYLQMMIERMSPSSRSMTRPSGSSALALVKNATPAKSSKGKKK